MKYLRAFQLRRFWLLLLLPAAFALDFMAKSSPDFAEWYAVTVYPVYAEFFSALTGILPFSLGELCLIALAVFLLVYLARNIYRLVRYGENRFERLVRFLSVPLLIAVCIAFLCVTNYGTNHRRYPFAAVSGLEVRDSSVEELYDLCVALTETANALREDVAEDENGVFTCSESVWADAKAAKSIFNDLHPDCPTLYTTGTPKPVFFSEVMSYLDISGIYCPFTFEANVNVHMDDVLVPVTMCHELSHLSGYMREDEANFIAFLACIRSDNADFRYSGAYLAMVNATNALFSADLELWKEVDALKSDALRRDVQSNNAYWKRYDTPVAEVSNKVNDAYLKANGQANGVRSYGRMVDLLLAYYRA